MVGATRDPLSVPGPTWWVPARAYLTHTPWVRVLPPGGSELQPRNPSDRRLGRSGHMGWPKSRHSGNNSGAPRGLALRTALLPQLPDSLAKSIPGRCEQLSLPGCREGLPLEPWPRPQQEDGPRIPGDILSPQASLGDGSRGWVCTFLGRPPCVNLAALYPGLAEKWASYRFPSMQAKQMHPSGHPGDVQLLSPFI